jgi:small-conductance mechanosensitive channel
MNFSDVWRNLTIYMTENTTFVQNFFLSMLVVVLLIIGRWLFLVLLDRQSPSTSVRYRWNKTTRYIVAGMAIIFIAGIWFDSISNLTTYLGLLSAGLAIALSSPISNLAGWAYILLRKPFTLEDRVQIGETKGDVIDVGMFMFSLMEVGNWVDAEQSTGRLIHIPNAKVFTEDIANYTQGFSFIWHEITVVVTFESNWEKAKQILSDIAKEYDIHLSSEAEAQMQQAANRFMIVPGTLTPKVYTRVVGSGVALTVRYLTETRQRRGSEELIWEDVLRAFALQADIDFAYTTQRVFFNQSEGKAGLREQLEMDTEQTVF